MSEAASDGAAASAAPVLTAKEKERLEKKNAKLAKFEAKKKAQQEKVSASSGAAEVWNEMDGSGIQLMVGYVLSK